MAVPNKEDPRLIPFEDQMPGFHGFLYYGGQGKTKYLNASEKHWKQVDEVSQDLPNVLWDELNGKGLAPKTPQAKQIVQLIASERPDSVREFSLLNLSDLPKNGDKVLAPTPEASLAGASPMSKIQYSSQPKKDLKNSYVPSMKEVFLREAKLDIDKFTRSGSPSKNQGIKLSSPALSHTSPPGSGWMKWEEFAKKYPELAKNIHVEPDGKGETRGNSGLPLEDMMARPVGNDSFELWDNQGPDYFPQHMVWDPARKDLFGIDE